MDKEWNRKHEWTLKERELYYTQLRQEKESVTSKFIKEKDDAILKIKEEVKNDIIGMDREFTKTMKKEKQRFDQLKRENSELLTKLKQSKEVVKLSADNITKKDNIIAELKNIINSSGRKIKDERDNIQKEREIIDEQKKKVMEEKLQLEAAIEELTYQNKDLKKKLELSQSFLNEKSNEYDENIKTSSDLKKKLSQWQAELETLKSIYQEETAALKAEVEKSNHEADEFEHICNTKDKMLDDKNNIIETLKSAVGEKEKEIKLLKEERDSDSQKVYYETKLQEEYEENERLRRKIEDYSIQIQDYEEDNDRINKDIEKIDYENSVLKQKLEQKDDLFKNVSFEVDAIKQSSLKDKQEISKRDEVIQDLKKTFKELNDSYMKKNQDLRTVIDKFESFKEKAYKEIEENKAELKTVKAENVILINKIENMKKAALNNISQFQNVFT